MRFCYPNFQGKHEKFGMLSILVAMSLGITADADARAHSLCARPSGDARAPRHGNAHQRQRNWQQRGSHPPRPLRALQTTIRHQAKIPPAPAANAEEDEKPAPHPPGKSARARRDTKPSLPASCNRQAMKKNAVSKPSRLPSTGPKSRNAGRPKPDQDPRTRPARTPETPGRLGSPLPDQGRDERRRNRHLQGVWSKPARVIFCPLVEDDQLAAGSGYPKGRYGTQPRLYVCPPR